MTCQSRRNSSWYNLKILELLEKYLKIFLNIGCSSSIMNLIMNKIWKLFQLYIFWFYIFIAFIWIFKFFYITSICWVMDNWNNLYFCRLKHGVRNELHKSGCYLATRYEKCKVNTFSESLWHRDEVDIWLVRAEEIVLDTILRFLNFLRK